MSSKSYRRDLGAWVDKAERLRADEETSQQCRKPETSQQMSVEKDPLGLDAKAPGAKLDSGKPPVVRGALQYFPNALRAVAELSAVGAAKYSWNGWESVPDGEHRYTEAMGRHLLAEAKEDFDKDTGLPHAYAVAWNALARLELALRRGFGA